MFLIFFLFKKWKAFTDANESSVVVGANDGALRAYSLSDGSEICTFDDAHNVSYLFQFQFDFNFNFNFNFNNFFFENQMKQYKAAIGVVVSHESGLVTGDDDGIVRTWKE